jgi:hypothetical protein
MWTRECSMEKTRLVSITTPTQQKAMKKREKHVDIHILHEKNLQISINTPQLKLEQPGPPFNHMTIVLSYVCCLGSNNQNIILPVRFPLSIGIKPAYIVPTNCPKASYPLICSNPVTSNSSFVGNVTTGGGGGTTGSVGVVGVSGMSGVVDAMVI